MGENSKISWTDSTFNPWIGCTKVSPGCANCYAEKSPAALFKGVTWGPGRARQRTGESNWNLPLRWNRKAHNFCECGACGWRGVLEFQEIFSPQSGGFSDLVRYCPRCNSGDMDEARPRVFCASLADWLDPDVSAEWLADLLGLIARTPSLDWQLLTKRPKLWRSRMEAVASTVYHNDHDGRAVARAWLAGNPPANVWVGTTVEDQQRANERIPALLNIPARVRFLSMEPLIEEVDLAPYLESPSNCCAVCGYRPVEGVSRWVDVQYPDDACPQCKASAWDARVNWVIVGGESGHKARPFDLGWARSIVQQCKSADVAVFVKQMGANPHEFDEPCSPFCNCGIGLYPIKKFADQAGAAPAEWPADLRVQEFPGGGK